MRAHHLAPLVLLAALASCGGPSLDTQTFELRYIDYVDERFADAVVGPYVYKERPGAPGTYGFTSRTITVRETPENLDRIALVLARLDRPPANVRLVFTVIHADGAGTRDSSLAPIEAQLRRLFRFRGYRAAAQAITAAVEHTEFNHELFTDGAGGLAIRIGISGELESASVRGDSGVVRVRVRLQAPEMGVDIGTRLSIGLNQTALLGGQSGSRRGALILSVRPELAAP